MRPLDRFLVSRRVREIVAYVGSAAILVAAGWFWWGQLQDVLELLALAAGG